MTRTRQLRQDLAILPMGVVSQLTGLSARQIRYYDQQNLINPERGSGQQRRYSLNQIERLMEIADYLDAGYSIADIHAVDQKKQKKADNLDQDAVRRSLQAEFIQIGRFGASKREDLS